MGIHAILRIVSWKGGNACLIGMCSNISIRNPPRDPHGTDFALPASNHFHNPHVTSRRIGKTEGFALGRIAVLVHEGGHGPYRVSGSFAPLESDVDEGSIVNFGVGLVCGVGEDADAAKGRFGDCEAVFVRVAYYVVGLVCFGYFTQVGTRIPIVDFSRGAPRVGIRGTVVGNISTVHALSRIVVEHTHKIAAVSIVCYECITGDRCARSD
mmetsp:Transcript_8637/g.12701  ORF Transcript_8637/g.12701 Transcript_8637/m.12701 type:complete len:211 (-) Transcript_8637:96-728(-)